MNRGNIFNKVLKKEMSGRGNGKKEEGRREKGGKSLFLLTIYAPIC
jgi:hypothetical protein